MAGAVSATARSFAAQHTLFKWSLMAAILFWTLVYKRSELGIRVPDFVYANF